MASAFRDKAGWIADFRPPNGRGKTRKRIRVPSRFLRGDYEADAKRFAEECERLSRLLETDGAARGDVRRARELGIVGEDFEASSGTTYRRPTLADAARAHPSTPNDKQAEIHLRQLARFVEWSGIEHVDGLSLDAVQRWIAEMKRRGLAYDTRRHHLLYLKRASRMAATMGGRDVLSGFRLDRREEPVLLEVWGLPDLMRAWASADRDVRIVLGLGGLMGLRPSEICRLEWRDVGDGILSVGARERKNAASRRTLPLPGIVADVLAPKGAAESPLIEPFGHGHAAGDPFDVESLGRWLPPRLVDADPQGRRVTPKELRKTFATWTVDAGLPPRDVEAFLGHSAGLVGVVTARHYLARAAAEQLRPTAEKIDEIAQEVLRSFLQGDESP